MKGGGHAHNRIPGMLGPLIGLEADGADARDVVPRLVRVGVLWNPGNPESAEHWQTAQPAARQLGLEPRSLEVRTGHEIDSLFDIAAREQCGAIIVSNGYLTGLVGPRIIALARAKRMPAMCTSREPSRPISLSSSRRASSWSSI